MNSLLFSGLRGGVKVKSLEEIRREKALRSMQRMRAAQKAEDSKELEQAIPGTAQLGHL